MPQLKKKMKLMKKKEKAELYIFKNLYIKIIFYNIIKLTFKSQFKYYIFYNVIKIHHSN